MSRPTAPQAELRNINYGHFGNPSYNPNLKEWSFTKLTESNARLIQLGNVEDTVPATGQFEKDDYLRDIIDQKKARYDSAAESEMRLLVASFPELQPAERWLKPQARLSEGIASALEDSDPAMTDVLDTGYISYSTEFGQETMRLLALPGGECGEALRLTRLDWQRYRAEGDREFELQHPSDETGWWMGKGAPILQICFSHGVEKTDKNALLAVRLQGCILFMFPRYRELAGPAKGIEVDGPPPRSRIDPNILFELQADQAQGERLADVAFNPWNHRVFVVVDHAGQWTIFWIKRVDGDFPNYEPVMVGKGCMPKIVEEELPPEAEEEAEEEGSEIEVDMGGLDDEAQESEDEVLPDWAVGLPQIKTSTSRKSSPVLQDVPEAITSETASEVGSGDQDAVNGEARGGEKEAQTTAEEEEAEEEEAPEIRQDGWTRATWVLNQDTLVVCSRKAIHLFDIRTNQHFDLPKLRATDTRSAGWFLDLKLCHTRPDYIFILTSYKLFLVRVFETEQLQEDEDKSKRILKGRIIIATLHFRDPADTTLRTSICEDEQGYWVTIFSQFSKVMTCFRFDAPRSTDERFRVSEPMALTAPEDAPDRTLGLVTKRVQLEDEDLYSMPSDTTMVESLHSIQFLGRDYGLRHAFFEARNHGVQRRMEAPHKLLSYEQPERKQRRSSFVVSDHEDIQSERNEFAQIDEFQDVLDDDEESEDNGPKTFTTTPSGQQWKPPRLREVEDACINNVAIDGTQLVQSIEIDEIPAVIQTATEAQKNPDAPARTLFEHLDHAMPELDDLRDASFQLEDAFSAASETAEVKLYPRAVPIPVDINEDEDEDVVLPFDDMHSYIEQQYIDTLDEGFPDAFKEQRRWLAKTIAAEVMLSSARIEYTNVKEEQATQDDVNADDLFVGSSQTQTTPSQSQSQSQSQHQDLDDDQRAQLALSKSLYNTTPSSQISTILSRLKRNTSINPNPEQKWTLKPLVILSHWDIGSDPSDYSFRETTARLEREKEFLGMTEQQRRKKARKEGLEQVRREREARQLERMSQLSSQAPVIQSSQAGVPGLSQQMGSQRVPAGSQRGSLRVPGGSQRASQGLTVPGLQIPGLAGVNVRPRPTSSRTGSQGQSQSQSQGVSQGASQISIPGFDFALPTPARTRTQPSSQFAPSQGTTEAGKGKEKVASHSQAQSDAGAGPSRSQPQTSQMGLPSRPAAATTRPSQSQPAAASQPTQGSQIPLLNFATPSASPAPSGSLSQGFVPRKVKKRKPGF